MPGAPTLQDWTLIGNVVERPEQLDFQPS